MPIMRKDLCAESLVAPRIPSNLQGSWRWDLTKTLSHRLYNQDKGTFPTPLRINYSSEAKTAGGCVCPVMAMV